MKSAMVSNRSFLMGFFDLIEKKEKKQDKIKKNAMIEVNSSI